MIGDLSFLKGNIQPIILNSLYNGDKYGYDIAREIKEKTANNYEIKQPTLYSYLKKLESEHLIESYWGAESNGGRRRYYRLTSHGRAIFEQYASQWNAQRNVMDTLVNNTSNAVDVSFDHMRYVDSTQQSEAASIGKKSRKRIVTVADIDEQSIIADRLAELEGTAGNATTPLPIKDSITVVETTTPPAQQNNDQPLANEVVLASEPIDDVHDNSYSDTIDHREKFDIQQEPVSSFLEDFDQRATILTQNSVQNSNEDYRIRLFDIVGDQLDNVDNNDNTTTNHSPTISTATIGLDTLADTFAKSGIRMRIYHSATAVYHSKKLIPLSKTMCTTCWITYAILTLIMSAVALLTLENSTTWSIAITTAIFILIPIGATLYMFSDPTRKVLKQLNYKLIFTVCIIAWIAFSLLAFAVNALFLGMKFNNMHDVVLNMVVPSIIALMPLCGLLVFKSLSKQ